MSMYADYLKERSGIEVLEEENGFVSYQILGKECFIHDAYISPKNRGRFVGTELMHKVESMAKELGCTVLTCTVCPSANGATDSMKAALSYGFTLLQSTMNLISLKKEI